MIKKTTCLMITSFILTILASCSFNNPFLDTNLKERKHNPFTVPFVATPFISEWNTGTVILPLLSSGSYNFLVDWGDGSSNIITSFDDAARSHNYGLSGKHVMSIGASLSKGFIHVMIRLRKKVFPE